MLLSSHSLSLVACVGVVVAVCVVDGNIIHNGDWFLILIWHTIHIGYVVQRHHAGEDGHHHFRFHFRYIFGQSVNACTNLTRHRNSIFSIGQIILKANEKYKL